MRMKFMWVLTLVALPYFIMIPFLFYITIIILNSLALDTNGRNLNIIVQSFFLTHCKFIKMDTILINMVFPGEEPWQWIGLLKCFPTIFSPGSLNLGKRKLKSNPLMSN